MDLITLIIQILPAYLKDLKATTDSYQHLFKGIVNLFEEVKNQIGQSYSVYPCKINFANFLSYYIRNEISVLPDGITNLNNPISLAYQSITIINEPIGDYHYQIIIPYNLEQEDRDKIQLFANKFTPFNKRASITYKF